MRIVEISDYSKFSGCKGEWEDIISRSKVNNVFLTYDWIDSCLKHFYADKRLLILNVFDGDKLVGIAPMVIKKDKYFGLPLKTLCFIGTSISDRMDFIIDGDREKVISLMFSYLMSIRKEWDIIDLQELAVYTGNADLIIRHIKNSKIMNIASEARDYFINLDAGKEAVFQEFSKKLDRRLKKIKNKGIDLNLEFKRRLGGDIDAERVFSEAEAVEGHSWKEERQSGIFSKKDTRDFHREILSRFSKNRWIDFSVLTLDKKPIAYIYNYLYGGRSYNYSVAFDNNYPLISAGTMLMLWAIKDSSLRNISEFDFARGEDSWKRRLTESYRIHNRVRIFKGSPYSRCLYLLQSKVMPYLKGKKILYNAWMRLKDAVR